MSDTKKHMYQYIQERVGLKVRDLQITKTQQKRKLLTLQKLDTLSSYNPVESNIEYFFRGYSIARSVQCGQC